MRWMTVIRVPCVGKCGALGCVASLHPRDAWQAGLELELVAPVLQVSAEVQGVICRFTPWT